MPSTVTRTLRGAAIAAAAIAALALSACSGSTPGATTSATAQKGEITYAIWGRPQLPMMQTYVKEYEKLHPGVTIDIDLTPYGQYTTKLQTEASSGTLPDIMWMNSDTFPLYAANNQLQPITNLVDDKQIDLAKFPAQLVKSYLWDQKQYGVPTNFDTIALWYNKALFDEAGQPYPTSDWTWDDYKTASAKITTALKTKGIYGTVAPIDDAQGSYYNSIAQAGGSVVSADGTKSGYGSAASIRGLNLWADLIKAGSSPNVQQLNESAPVTWFTSGKAAMIWAGSYNISTMQQSSMAKDFGIVALPHDKKAATVLNGATNVVAATSKHKDIAQGFQAYIASKQAADLAAKNGVVIPAYDGVQEQWASRFPDWDVQVFIDSVKNGVPFPRSINSAPWEKLATDSLPAGFSGQQPMNDVAKSLASKMNALLAQEK